MITDILMIILIMALISIMASEYYFKRKKTLKREQECKVEINGKVETRIYLEQNLDGTHKVVAKGFEEMFNAGLKVPTENYKEVF